MYHQAHAMYAKQPPCAPLCRLPHAHTASTTSSYAPCWSLSLCYSLRQLRSTPWSPWGRASWSCLLASSQQGTPAGAKRNGKDLVRFTKLLCTAARPGTTECSNCRDQQAGLHVIICWLPVSKLQLGHTAYCATRELGACAGAIFLLLKPDTPTATRHVCAPHQGCSARTGWPVMAHNAHSGKAEACVSTAAELESAHHRQRPALHLGVMDGPERWLTLCAWTAQDVCLGCC